MPECIRELRVILFSITLLVVLSGEFAKLKNGNLVLSKYFHGNRALPMKAANASLNFPSLKLYRKCLAGMH